MERFVADAMLGRLTRWLRFLGYDVLYFRDIEDRELVKTARAGDRVILTRDRGLVQDFHVRHYLVESEILDEQLSEVLGRFPLKQNPDRRCMKCNTEVVAVTNKEEIRDSVPEYVYFNHDSFQKCPSCGSIYWEGSHMRRIIKRIEKAVKPKDK
ncbi:hypothetical protein BMS3Bbin06_00570 [bacterium BMS3Bbin06]|nr:hypothetical protein BMS3Abin08_02299 [bacterium BMS3Abin08]GBE34054.1 hypothetical protein BMS3Bbin06_00570 [bacterium BMS3Bbin06]HDO35323.1 hypothetical protein [Nitrospirota bacterium]